MGQPIQVFCCYAREDQPLLLELKDHLRLLERNGLIMVLADVNVSPGEEWEERISYYLDTAQIILLLISSRFMASDYCYSKEMKRAIERHKTGQACVIPVILRPVDWRGAPFSKLQALPANAQPITSWSNQDEAFFNVEKGLRDALEKHMILSRSQEIALFGYETQGGSRSLLWSNPATFSFHELYETYLDWSEEKRRFTEEEIIGHTWVKAGDHGYAFVIHFLPHGQFYEDPILGSARQLQGSWQLVDGVLKTTIEQEENGIPVIYTLDIFANEHGLAHSGVEFSNQGRDPNYFVFLPSHQPLAKHYEEAITAFRQLLEVNQSCAEVYQAIGELLRNLARYEEAVTAYQRAIELRPDYMWTWYNLGNALNNLQQFEEALKAYQRATKFDPAYFGIWLSVGEVLHTLGHLEEALTAFDQAIKHNEYDSMTWRARGETLQVLGRYEEALTSYEQALVLAYETVPVPEVKILEEKMLEGMVGYYVQKPGPQHVLSIWTRRGQVFHAIKRYEEAITAYDKALELGANDIDVYLDKGRAYLGLANYDEALRTYEQAISIAPDDTWAWHDKGQALGYLQRAEEALAAFDRAVELDPENKWAWFHKAETLEYLARLSYQKAGQPGKKPPKREYYHLLHKVTGKCLDGDGVTVFMREPNGESCQLWKAEEISPRMVVLKHFQSGKVLEATQERGGYLSEYTNNPSQQWIPLDDGDGYKRFRHAATSMMLDMMLYGDTNNDVYLQSDNGGDFQAWMVAKISITPLIADTSEYLAFEQ